MGTISENFSYREFEESATAEKEGIINIIHTVQVRDSIKALVDEVLQPLRTAWERPLVINSGYRCPELNREVGGVATSQHVKGEAADVACDDPLGLAQLAYDMNLPYDQMILYPTFVHFSHRPDGGQRRQVLYNKSWKGNRIRQ